MAFQRISQTYLKKGPDTFCPNNNLFLRAFDYEYLDSALWDLDLMHRQVTHCGITNFGFSA